MIENIKSINQLPQVDEIKRLSQSLAVLDAILMPEWEYRYFSFNSKWSTNEMMASMRDGEGNEYFLLFNKYGMIGKIYTTILKNTPIDIERISHKIPTEFNSFINEPAFKLSDITCCIFKQYTDNNWNVLPIIDEIPLLGFIIKKQNYYHRWAEEYYEKNLDHEIITNVFNYLPLNNSFIKKLNNNIIIENIKQDIQEIGYPINDII